ncbi:MAG: hypothetical protein ACU85E_03915 [Gammaproteobacteria bacterium]
MPLFKRSATILLMLFLSACSVPFMGGYGERGQTREEFIRYVESVFKFQNQMTSRVMMLLETEEDLGEVDEILQAEQKMHEICEPLNEYAARENDGMSIGLLLRRRVEKSAVACDKAARQVDSYLKASRAESSRPSI